jgi:hypothetical protein
MSVNNNWSRWIFASLCVWFDNNRGSIPMYVEGDDANTADLADYIEFRMNGPLMEEFSKGSWRFDILINILVVSKRNDKSIHTMQSNIGTMQAAFATNIPIYKFGTGPDDDRTQLLGCMTLCDQIETTLLGQVSPDTKEQQAMVEGHYRMFIEV